MTRLRRFTTALVLATSIAGGMVVATAPVEAKGKKPGGQEAICDYLRAIIDNQWVSSYIKIWAISLYKYYGCEPELP